jgi:hypothetical protein
MTFLRITVNRTHVWILYAVISLTATASLILLFVTIFQCQPVDYFWNQRSGNGTCVDKSTLTAIAYLYSGSAAMTDLMIGFLPMVFVWKLQMTWHTKGAIVGILGIGCMFVTFVSQPLA